MTKRDFKMLALGAFLAVSVGAFAAARTGFTDITDTAVGKWHLKVFPSAKAGVKWEVKAYGVWDFTERRNGSRVAERFYDVQSGDEANFKLYVVDKYMEQLITDEELPPVTAADF